MTASTKVKLSKTAQARIARYAHEFRTLVKESARVRNAKIKKATRTMVNALADCARALIKGIVSLDRKQLRAIRQREQKFRALMNYKTNLTDKKNILQSGGFLQALIGPLFKAGLPIVTNLLGGLLGGGAR